MARPIHEVFETATWPRPWAEMVKDRFAQHSASILQFTSNRDLSTLGPLASIVSSQLPSRDVEANPWNQIVESILLAVKRDTATLLIGSGTPLEERLVHWCRRLELPYLRLFIESSPKTPGRASSSGYSPIASGLAMPAERSWKATPSVMEEGWLRVDVEDAQRAGEGKGMAVIDRLLSWLPDRLFAISLRKNGKTTHAIDARLDSSAFPLASVHCALGDWQPEEARTEARRMMDRGAVGWWCSTSNQSYEFAWLPWLRVMANPLAPIVPDHPVLRAKAGEWLTHCTRARRGAWPDTTAAQHADEMLLQPMPHAGAWLTLARILQQRRMIATTYLRRSSIPTVCCSALPLVELLQHRRYRPHLGRWDWEPYGLCIRRRVAISMGARPVIYGNDSQFHSLTEEDAPYFQASHGAKSQIDWGFEQEWRFIGDVKLGKIPWADACVFVPTMTEARWVARLSPFPVVPLKCDG